MEYRLSVRFMNLWGVVLTPYEVMGSHINLLITSHVLLRSLVLIQSLQVECSNIFSSWKRNPFVRDYSDKAVSSGAPKLSSLFEAYPYTYRYYSGIQPRRSGIPYFHSHTFCLLFLKNKRTVFFSLNCLLLRECRTIEFIGTLSGLFLFLFLSLRVNVSE